MKSHPTQPSDQIISILYPKDGKLRARKVISRSKARPTGKYPSWKMGRMMHWESPHELNAFRLLDAMPAVISFHEQPLVIRFILDGKDHFHFPDVLVNFGSFQELWEIKPAGEAAAPDVVARTLLLQRELPQKGFTYRVVTGEDLAKEPRLGTILTLLRHGRRPISLMEREQVRLLFNRTHEISWGAAFEKLAPSGFRVLARLFLEGHVTCNIGNPLTAATTFWRTPTPKDH